MPRYNGRRRTAADRCADTDPDPQTSCNAVTPGLYDYTYDPIGDRTSSNVDNALGRTGHHSTDGELTLDERLRRITGHIPHHVRFIEEKKLALRR